MESRTLRQENRRDFVRGSKAFSLSGYVWFPVDVKVSFYSNHGQRSNQAAPEVPASRLFERHEFTSKQRTWFSPQGSWRIRGSSYSVVLCITNAESFCSVRRFFPERHFPFGCGYAALCLCGERFVSQFIHSFPAMGIRDSQENKNSRQIR